jgi:hypothetical protein
MSVPRLAQHIVDNVDNAGLTPQEFGRLRRVGRATQEVSGQRSLFELGLLMFLICSKRGLSEGIESMLAPHSLLTAVSGRRFGTILADPPWQFHLADIMLQQTVSAVSQEFEISLISEYLELLANFLAYESIHRIEPAEVRLESIDFIEVKFLRADFFDALHNVYEPASRCGRFISQEERLTP